MKWVRFSVCCPELAVEAVVGIMLDATGCGPTVEDGPGGKLVSCYVPDGSEAQSTFGVLQMRVGQVVPELTGGQRLEVAQSLVEEEDWAEAWKAHYRPLRIGRHLVVKPSWEEWPPGDDPAAASPEDLVIELDPQMAFGTGTHASTQLCLAALEDLVGAGMAVLDVGCGSGILSLAAAGLGAGRVVAIDVDPVAVETARANVARNAMADRITVRLGSVEAVAENGFDLVVANVNPRVVKGIAEEVNRRLGDHGLYVAAGLIEEVAPEVEAVLMAAGFDVVEVRHQEGWACIVARKAAQKS